MISRTCCRATSRTARASSRSRRCSSARPTATSTSRTSAPRCRCTKPGCSNPAWASLPRSAPWRGRAQPRSWPRRFGGARDARGTSRRWTTSPTSTSHSRTCAASCRFPRAGPDRSGRRPLPISIAQQPLVDLAVVLTRELFDELYAARGLIVREPVAAEGDELVGEVAARLLARAQLDHREHLLTPFRVRDPDDGDVGDRGMLEQRGVHLGRVDVHTARDDEVGGAVGEEQETVVVEIAQVAEREVTV